MEAVRSSKINRAVPSYTASQPIKIVLFIVIAVRISNFIRLYVLVSVILFVIFNFLDYIIDISISVVLLYITFQDIHSL
jgi:hypothetical protein